MGLFTKRERVAPIGAADLAAWRGRGHDLPDAGACRWEIVFESLKIAADPRPDDELEYLDLIMAPLALRSTERRLGYRASTGDLRYQNLYRGTRYGRPVELRQGNQTQGQKGAMVAWVLAATPEFRVSGVDGRAVAERDAPAEVVELLAGLTANADVWSALHVTGGPQGIVVKRPITTRMFSQAWIYDLWLAERLADRAAIAVLPAPAGDDTDLPYRLARTHTW